MTAPTKEGRSTVVKWTPLAELHGAPWNPRSIKTTAFKALCASMEADPDFLWRRPILATQSGEIYAGNMRYRAAEVLGWSAVPAVVEDVPDRLAKERALRDNNQSGEWDEQGLAELLYGLQQEGAALEALAFDHGEVERLLASVGVGGSDEAPEIDPDRAEELRQKWQTAPGQLWAIGRHRLLCGDSTNAEDVERVLGGATPHLCVTDPPYGVDYDPAWRNVAAAAGHLAYAPSRIGEVTNDNRADWHETWTLFPGDVIYSWHPAGATSLVHAAALQDSGFVLRMQIIWAKSNFPIGRGDYHVRHEPCWYAVRKDRPSRRTDDRTQTTLWEINLDRNVEGGHSTQKPLECMARPIRNHEGDVYDPFVGSGTTLVAAEQLGRTCYAIDIEPKWVAVCLDRLSKMGLTPRLVAP